MSVSLKHNSSGTPDISFYVDTATFKTDQNGDATVEGDLESTSLTAVGLIHDYSTLNVATTVDTTTPILDFSTSDYFELEMPDADKVLQFCNPRRANILLRVQHNANAHTLTFPTAYWITVTGTSAKVYTLSAGDTKFTFFNIFCDGNLSYSADLTTGVVALYADAELGPTWDKTKATDDNSGTTFIPTNIKNEGGHWLAINLGAIKCVNRTTLQGWLNFGTFPYNCKDFKIQACNDSTDGSDGTWIDLYTGLQTQDYDVHTFDIGNYPPYQWWRWYGVTTFTDEYLGLCEWELKTATSNYWISDVPFTT